MSSARMRLSLVPEDVVILVDRLTFLVPVRRFQVEGTLLRNGYVSLATEFAMRLLRDAGELAPTELGTFLGFSDEETRILVQELLIDGYLDVFGDKLRLATKGEQAFDPSTGELRLLDVEVFTDTVTLDLISFAPVDAYGSARLPWLKELDIPDKEKAAAGSREGTQGFRANFGEWRDRKFHGDGTSPIRLHTLTGDAEPLARSSAPITIPITYIPSRGDEIDPDFSTLRDRGRRDARKDLVEAMNGAVRRIVAPGDHAEGARFSASWDEGVLIGPGPWPTVNPLAWLQIASRSLPSPLPEGLSPAVRLGGSLTSSGVLSVLSNFLDGVAGPETDGVPVVWVPASHAAWGSSADLLDVTRRMKSNLAPKAGITLLPRSEVNDWAKRELVRAYGLGRDGRQTPLFDTCVMVPSTAVPLSLELIVQPGFWAVVLLHVPSKEGFPVPIGYATRNLDVVRTVASVLGEILVDAPDEAVVWSDREANFSSSLDELRRWLSD